MSIVKLRKVAENFEMSLRKWGVVSSSEMDAAFGFVQKIVTESAHTFNTACGFFLGKIEEGYSIPAIIEKYSANPTSTFTEYEELLRMQRIKEEFAAMNILLTTEGEAQLGKVVATVCSFGVSEHDVIAQIVGLLHDPLPTKESEKLHLFFQKVGHNPPPVVKKKKPWTLRQYFGKCK